MPALNSLLVRLGAALATAFVLALPLASPASASGSELKCLSDTLYFEARGESLSGQKAVAEVILNRRDSGKFPSTICGVVKQGSSKGCQFSYNCGKPRAIREKGAYERVSKVAAAALAGAPRTLTAGATYFHTTGVKPSWSRVFTRTARIGRHIFYNDGRRLASN